MQHKHTDQTQENKPSDVHYYHAKIMQDVEESDWMKQGYDVLVHNELFKECGINTTHNG